MIATFWAARKCRTEVRTSGLHPMPAIGVRGSDLTIFPGIWAQSSRRLLLSAEYRRSYAGVNGRIGRSSAMSRNISWNICPLRRHRRSLLLTPGTRLSISRGKSCPSHAAIGQPQVTQSEGLVSGIPPMPARGDDGSGPENATGRIAGTPPQSRASLTAW
jgi:hypothetical protein